MSDDAGFGCQACWPPKAEEAYDRIDVLTDVARLVDSSHFSIRVVACPTCAQRFVSVFCETVDWQDGEDPQALRLVPITPDESTALLAAGERARGYDVECLGARRRHLVMDWPKGAERRVRWCNGGLIVPAHD